MNLFPHRSGTVSTPEVTPAPAADATLSPSIEANIPPSDRGGIRKLISDAISSAISPFSRAALVADPAATSTSSPSDDKAAKTTTKDAGALRRFFGYCWSKALGAFSSARDFLIALASQGARNGGVINLDGSTEDKPTERPTPRVSRTASSAHDEEAWERTRLGGEEIRLSLDPSSSSVAEATRKEHERKKELMLASELRSKRRKSTAADTMRAIDAENGIVNPDLAIMIDNLMGCFGEETSAIRAIIEAQARERDPLKKKH